MHANYCIPKVHDTRSRVETDVCHTMKRARLSLKRKNVHCKKPDIKDFPQQYERPSQGPVPGSVSGSELETADADGDDDTVDADKATTPNLNDDAFLVGLDSGGDYEVKNSQDYPMSLDRNSVDSGHQMETESVAEEDGDEGDLMPPHSTPCCPTSDAGVVEVDCATDPVSVDDLCTHYGLSDTALSVEEFTQFEDFGMQYNNSSVKRQTSLLSFMTRTSSSTSSSVPTNSMGLTDNTCMSSASKPAGTGKRAIPAFSPLDTGMQPAGGSQGNKTDARAKRTCPFYKRIPGIFPL